jgi:hypothetical protein
MLGDPERVLEHVHQQERQHPDREHRQGDPRASVQEVQAAERQAQEDRETCQRSQHNGLAE